MLFLMKKILIPLSVSLLLVALIAYFLASDSGEQYEEYDGVESAQQATEQGGGAGGADEQAAPGEGSSETTDEEGEAATAGAQLSGALLHGTVLDLEGNPIPAARVLLRATGSWEGMEDADRYTMFRQRILGKESVPVRGGALNRTETDASGKYAFALSAIKPGRYDILTSAAGFAPGNERWKWTSESAKVDFQLGLGEVIKGVVRSPEGAPVEGVVVTAAKAAGRGWGGGRGPGGSTGSVDETLSDANGLFSLNVYAGEFDVRGNSTGYSTGAVDAVASGSVDVELMLGKGRGVGGLVMDASNNPLAGVKLSLYENRMSGFGRGRGGPPRGIMRLFSSPLAVSESGADGRFIFSDMEDGNFRIMAEKDAFVTTEVTGELKEEAEKAEVSISMA
ncbi:MAG TPA: hypothetical protein DD471_11640, partial [Planctomycetes bacterium]|nr:hypothetical protein [Planctomycetota bacterium]